MLFCKKVSVFLLSLRLFLAATATSFTLHALKIVIKPDNTRTSTVALGNQKRNSISEYINRSLSPILAPNSPYSLLAFRTSNTSSVSSHVSTHAPAQGPQKFCAVLNRLHKYHDFLKN